MEVILAKSAGFCFGVQRAIDTVYDQINSEEKIHTYGPIIHNTQVVAELEDNDVHVVKNLDEVESGKVVIRSHGVSKAVYDEIDKRCLCCVDATCPFVKRIHKIVKTKSEEGYKIIIIGNDGHPEVDGIKGWASTNAIVVEKEEDIDKIDIKEGEKIYIVAQTTFNHNKFKDLVEIFLKKNYNVNVVNTICSATEERQVEAKKIAATVDTMIVIGDRHSSNSKKLYEICKTECNKTIFVQNLQELKSEDLSHCKVLGITAGASTPNNIIEEVQNYVRINF